jgi:hypothetical protein
MIQPRYKVCGATGTRAGLSPILRPYTGGTMQDRGYGLPRSLLTGSSVNMGKRKGRGC